MVKLDIGCGTKKQDGFIGVDRIAFAGVDVVINLAERDLSPNGPCVNGVQPCTLGEFKPWPWGDGEVDEVYSSHFLEHLRLHERVYFMNELYRVMKPGAKATVIVPHWASSRAYGDPTHQWPPIGEFWFYYLKKEWRMQNAPHTDREHWPGGYCCDFDATWGYGMHPTLVTRNPEFQQFALNFYREAAQDIHATLVKRELSA